jgi:hypothetical protein
MAVVKPPWPWLVGCNYHDVLKLAPELWCDTYIRIIYFQSCRSLICLICCSMKMLNAVLGGEGWGVRAGVDL